MTLTRLRSGKHLSASFRGKFIQHGSQLKRAGKTDISCLLANIASLEESHKWSPDPTTQLDLTNARRDLLRIFAERSLVARDRGRFTHYSQANKCGKYLANVLHPRHARNPISFINSPSKGKVLTNSAIAEEFRQYYFALYNLTPQARPSLSQTSKSTQDLLSYVQEIVLPNILA